MAKLLRFFAGAVVLGVAAGGTAFGLYYYFGNGSESSNNASAVASTATADKQLSASMQFTDLEGHTHELKQWRGKLLLINFWATWCVPCRKEIPYLAKAQKRYGPHGFQVIGPAVDDPKAVRAQMQSLGIDYPVMTGTPEAMINRMDTLGNRLGALPFSVLVGPDGRVIDRHLGAFSSKELNLLIEHNLPG
ncbi:MAG: TlpA family protein disulfide reductase [Sinobacteraceae bacterium]|nr:TlpA family protein disulfide reductase [Nevskiaceae bacterium]